MTGYVSSAPNPSGCGIRAVRRVLVRYEKGDSVQGHVRQRPSVFIKATVIGSEPNVTEPKTGWVCLALHPHRIMLFV